jgi:hypothetical protein
MPKARGFPALTNWVPAQIRKAAFIPIAEARGPLPPSMIDDNPDMYYPLFLLTQYP